MKYITRVFLFNTFGIWLTSQVLPTIHINGNWQILTISGSILSILMLVVAPILRILFIPINLITFGLLSWFINVIVLYLLTFFVPEITVVPWQFPGSSWSGFIVPPMYLSYFPSLVISSLTLTFITNLLHKVSEG